MSQTRAPNTLSLDSTALGEAEWYDIPSSPYYSDSHRKVRTYVRDYMKTNVLPYQEEWDEAGEVPRVEGIEFAQAGLAFPEIPAPYRPGVGLRAGIPEEEWDIFQTLILNDEISRANSGTLSALCGASAIGAPPIVLGGSDEQKNAWLPGIFTGETSLWLCMMEPPGSSELTNLQTTATRTANGKSYIVNGRKEWIPDALICSHMTTAVRTRPRGAKGVNILS